MDRTKEPELSKGSREQLFAELVMQAEQRARLNLPHQLEGYLVLTLLRHLRIETAQALFECLAPRLLCGRVRGEPSLRDTGDACLMLAGLFPEQASRRHVNVGYFIGIGRSAYSRLAASSAGGPLFGELSEHFPELVGVLQAVRSEERKLSPLAAFETWQATGLADQLEEIVDGTPVRVRQTRLI